METEGVAKTNMGAREFDPRVLVCGTEIRRRVKTRAGKIGGLPEGPAGENGLAIEIARART
jgi:hypothetical protein